MDHLGTILELTVKLAMAEACARIARSTGVLSRDVAQGRFARKRSCLEWAHCSGVVLVHISPSEQFGTLSLTVNDGNKVQKNSWG